MASKEEPPKEESATATMDATPEEGASNEPSPQEGGGDTTMGEAPDAAAAGDGAPAAAAGTGDARGKRVYVGNLAWEVSWQDLKDHMKTTGLEVHRANVMLTPDGRSKGCGIVEFHTAEDAQQAVATLNDTELKGRQIFVREDREDRGGGAGGFGGGGGGAAGGGGHYQQHHQGGGGGTGGHRFSSGGEAQTRRVYVGNLSWDVAWQDLKDHMRQAGDVVHAEVITEHSGRSKGCGIVEFSTPDQAANAIATLTDTELKGRMIFVREDRETSSQAGHHGYGGRGQQANTSVYVWNLASETSWQDLKDHMRKAGNVDSATILTNSSGESINCGVVVYQRPQEAMRAIRELQNSDLNGKPLYLREDRSPGRGGGGRGGGGRGGGGRAYGGYGGQRTEEGTQLYVGNLAFETTWRELKDHFRQCGDVRRAEVVMGPGGTSKGFGTVQFYQKSGADAAIERLHGSELQGRELEVRLDQKAR